MRSNAPRDFIFRNLILAYTENNDSRYQVASPETFRRGVGNDFRWREKLFMSVFEGVQIRPHVPL